MVIGGADGYDGLLRVAEKFAGQSAEVVMALGLVFPEPPLGAEALVVEVLEALVVEVLEAEEAVVFFFDPLESQVAIPTTTAATMTRVITLRSACFRFWAFFSASRRAWRPAF
jgi:hypothetical protein